MHFMKGLFLFMAMIRPFFGGPVLTSCPSMCPVSGDKCDLGTRYNYINANTRNDNGQAAALCRACFHTNPASWQSNSQSQWNDDRRTSDESISSNVWIGAYLKQGVSSTWSKSNWLFNDCTSMPTSSPSWASSNPNRAGGCMTISSSSGMNDRSCSSNYDVLCNSLAWERNNVPVHCRREPTFAPTRVPSVVPSASPSTGSPSSSSPTSNPTSTPTTSSPITSNPTTSGPTTTPTTTAPTTAIPTGHPTFRPTNRPTSTPTSDPISRTTPLNTSAVVPPNSKLDIPVSPPRRGNEVIVGAGAGAVFGLCCFCIGITCFLRRKRKPNELNTELASRHGYLASESPKSSGKPSPAILRVASEDPDLHGRASDTFEREPDEAGEPAPASGFLGQLQDRVAIDDVLLDVIVEDMAAGNDDEDILAGPTTTNGNAEGLAGPQVENDFNAGGELELAPQNDGPVAFGVAAPVSTAAYGNEVGEGDPDDTFEDVPMEEWTRHNVGEWFARVGRDSVWEEYGKMMQQQKIDGMTLKHLTEDDMRNLGVRSFHISALKSAIDEHQQREHQN